MPVALKTLTQSYLKELADFQPVSAIAWGMPGGEAKVIDLSEGRIRRHLSFLKEARKKLKQGGRTLPGVESIEGELLNSDILLREQEWGSRKKYRQDPTRYIGDLVYGLWYLHLRCTDKSLKVEASLKRLRDANEVLSAARANLKNPPKLLTKIAIQEAEGFLAFLAEIRRELLRLAPKRRREIQAAIEAGRKVGEAFLKFYRDLLKTSRGKFAVGRGEFDFLLKNYHHYDLEADELLRLGKEKFSEVRSALEEQARRINPRLHWNKVVEQVKDEHPARGKILKSYRDETSRLKKFLVKNRLVSIPSGEKLSIIETPVFTRHTIPFAAYVDPPMFKGKNYGTFFVTPVTVRDSAQAKEMLEEHNYPALKVTALHEGYPGHHLQFAKQKGAKGTMMKIYNCSSFYEGWALYCEEMMHECGYYDAKTRLMQLKDKLWRACRILVDVNIQLGRWTDEEAVSFMAKELKMARASARADVNWYTMSPTVPQSYFTGMLRIKQLREKYRKKLGSRFTLKKFHDDFLQFGAIPVPLVEKYLLS